MYRTVQKISLYVSPCLYMCVEARGQPQVSFLRRDMSSIFFLVCVSLGPGGSPSNLTGQASRAPGIPSSSALRLQAPPITPAFLQGFPGTNSSPRVWIASTSYPLSHLPRPRILHSWLQSGGKDLWAHRLPLQPYTGILPPPEA